MDVMRRVVTLFEARGANQVRASLGEMRSGFSGYRREVDQAGRSTGYINNQLRALGTTLRYAFAGQAIFGTLQMVKSLGEFEGKLGEISSIATGPGGLPIIGRQLDELGDDLIRVSNETAQPISDLQEGVLNLYSTIGDVPPDEASAMMETIAETAVTAQSNIQDTTQALLGMLDAFGRGTNELPKFGDEFYRVIQLSAGMPGRIYAQQLGRLSASATLGNFTPEEMGALAIGATRSGGSAATNMRGLAQLMTFVMNPSGTKSEGAFRSIGLGRQERNRLGGWATLQRVLEIARERGVSGDVRGLTDDQAAAMAETFGDDPTAAQAGLSGEGSELLSRLFPRIEGRRIAAVLSRLQTPEQVAGTPNLTLDTYLDNVTNSAEMAHEAMERAMDRKRIQQAGNAIHNFGVELGIAMNPVLNPAARGVTAATGAFGNQKWGIGPATGQEVEILGGGIGLALLLKRLRHVGASGKLVRGAGGLGAGLDAITQTAQGHTPLHPLYVYVVGSLGGWGRQPQPPIPPRPGGVQYPAPIGPMTQAEAKAAARRNRLASARSAGYKAAHLAGWVGVGITAEELILGDSVAQQRMTRTSELAGAKGNPLLRMLSGRYNKATQAGPGALNAIEAAMSPAERKIVEAAIGGKISAAAAEERLRRIATPDQLRQSGAVSKVKGQAEITINDKRTRKRHHVTVDLIEDFKVPAPQTKGKNKTHRGAP